MKFNLTSKVEVINVIKLRIILKQYIDKTIRKKIEYITLNWIFEVLEIYIDAAYLVLHEPGLLEYYLENHKHSVTLKCI